MKTNFINNFQRDMYAFENDEVSAPTKFGEWQLCPKCNGQGIVIMPSWVAGDATTWLPSTVQNHTCHVCNGAKILARPIITQ